MRRCRLPFFVFVIVGLWVTAWATDVAARFTLCGIRGLFGGKGLWAVLPFKRPVNVRTRGGRESAYHSETDGERHQRSEQRNERPEAPAVYRSPSRRIRGLEREAVGPRRRGRCSASAKTTRQSPGDAGRAAAPDLPNRTTTQLCIADDRCALARSSAGFDVGPSGACGGDVLALGLGLAPYCMSSLEL